MCLIAYRTVNSGQLQVRAHIAFIVMHHIPAEVQTLPEGRSRGTKVTQYLAVVVVNGNDNVTVGLIGAGDYHLLGMLNGISSQLAFKRTLERVSVFDLQRRWLRDVALIGISQGADHPVVVQVNSGVGHLNVHLQHVGSHHATGIAQVQHLAVVPLVNHLVGIAGVCG